MQRAVRAAADVVRAAPVEELVAGLGGGEHLAGRAAAQRRPDARRARRGSGASAGGRPRRASASTSRSPSTLHVSAAQVGEVAARGEAQLAAPRCARRPRRRDGRSCASRGRRRRAQQRALDARDERRAALAVEHVDLRRARARAHGDLARSPSCVAPPLGGQHGEVVERANRSISSSTCDCEWSEQTITAWSSRNASGAAGGVHHPLELAVGGGERGHLRVRAVLVGVRVVVGQREQQEVEEVVLDEVGADAAGVLVADARAGRAASGSRSAARRTGRRRRTPAGRARAAGRRSRRSA